MPRPACPLILIHIPKTAGTTLSHMLRLHYGLKSSNWLRHGRTLGYYRLGYARPEHMNARFSRIASLSRQQSQHVRFFAAHAGFGLRDRFPPSMRADAAYITVLRDPIARMISTFHHLRSEERLPRDSTLRQYVDQRRHFGLFKFDNCQTRYLAGEHGVAIDCPCGEVSRDMLTLAMHRLEHELMWFGVTERFDESLLLLTDAIGWKRPRYVRARVRKTADRRDAIDEDLMREMRDLNALDIELHQHALRVLDSRIAAQGSEYSMRVARFQIDNTKHRRWMTPIGALLPAARSALNKIGLLR